MDFRLVDNGWDRELESALATAHRSIRVVSPFIKASSAERLLRHGRPDDLQVITRFNLDDFSDGVSDIAALRHLLKAGARIRGIRNLHSKLYLFGDQRAIVTSANLTESGLTKNHEFGFVASEAVVVARCRQYFDELWQQGGPDLIPARLAEWESRVTRHLASASATAARSRLGDEGVDIGLGAEPIISSPFAADADQGFVKFFGDRDNRALRNLLILDEVKASGSHWACTYPTERRPRQVRDGAIMFMGRQVQKPNDILVYGRAVGMAYQEGRDDASTADLSRRPWKKNWQRYIRVHHPEFIAGSLANAVSLNEMMEELRADSFATTQQHAREGVGNTDPRRAYIRQPAVELSLNGMAWLNTRLEDAYSQHGKLPASALARLDWPDVIVDPDALAP